MDEPLGKACLIALDVTQLFVSNVRLQALNLSMKLAAPLQKACGEESAQLTHQTSDFYVGCWSSTPTQSGFKWHDCCESSSSSSASSLQFVISRCDMSYSAAHHGPVLCVAHHLSPSACDMSYSAATHHTSTHGNTSLRTLPLLWWLPSLRLSPYSSPHLPPIY